MLLRSARAERSEQTFVKVKYNVCFYRSALAERWVVLYAMNRHPRFLGVLCC